MARNETVLPPTSRGAATRARIVDAAAELIRTRGVAGTSVDAVLEASDASKSQLYHYFADKGDLVLAVIQRQTEYILADQATLLRGVRSLAGLRRWRDELVKATRRGNCAGGCRLGSLVSALAETPRSRAVLAEGFARWRSVFVEALTGLWENADRKPGAELDDLATTLLAAFQGGVLLAQTTRSTRPLELALDAAIARIGEALGRDGGPRSRATATRRSARPSTMASAGGTPKRSPISRRPRR